MKTHKHLIFLLGIVLSATMVCAQNQSQLDSQNQPGAATYTDSAKTEGVHPPGTPGIEISNPTQYAKQENAPPLFTAEAGDDDFKSNLPLVGLFGLLGLWGYFRKPVEQDDVV